MNVASTSIAPLVFALLVASVPSAAEPASPGPLVLVVKAGRLARKDTPVRVELPGDRLGEPLRAALADGPKPVLLRELRDGSPIGEPIVAQAEQAPDASEGKVRLTWILAGETPADTRRTFRLESGRPEAASPWRLSDETAGALELWHGKRMVFRYNIAPVTNPGYGPIQHRDAYLHPALTPSGSCITGDFSSSHPHHRGFFLAYAKAEVGPLHPDFWNIHTGSGKIHFDRLGGTAVGPVTARIEGWHRWEGKEKSKGAVPVLHERWDVEAYDIPGSPYWLFDLTSTQVAIGEPLKVHPYRYGGMAYRGPEPFVRGKLDVLTSAGLDRIRGDQKPARWVDLTGPIADGSDQYAGAMILDHPTNLNSPTVARIHPTWLPFFCYVPGHDVAVTISADSSTIFRYRVMIHDGRPDAALDERLWGDFAEPPRVTIVAAGG